MKISIYLAFAFNFIFFFAGFFTSMNMTVNALGEKSKIADDAIDKSRKALRVSLKYRDQTARLSNALAKQDKSFKNCLVENAKLKRPRW